jgi:hypothetical protein
VARGHATQAFSSNPQHIYVSFGVTASRFLKGAAYLRGIEALYYIVLAAKA